jgi:hypothetical protein
MENQRIKSNFQTLNALLSELQNNMNSAIPEIYIKLQEKDNRDFGQKFLSNLFWSAFELISNIDTLEGAHEISWILNAFVEDIQNNLEKYPDLNDEISSIYERMQSTITHIKNEKISPIVDNPDNHLNDTFTYDGNVITISDFNNFDFVYASSGYNLVLTNITRECKKEVLKGCFPYDKWKVSFYFGESPANPCKQCNWGCDGYIDNRSFFEDMDAEIYDNQGNLLANNIYDWVNKLSKDSHKCYVIEPISSFNVRLNNMENYKEKYPNGAFVNEYCLTWGRDDFFNDWVDFDDNIGKWMFLDDMNGNTTNWDGFVNRSDFYYNWNLDACQCIWKHTPTRPPNFSILN